MTYFSKDQVSSCEIAGAVAEAAIHDLRVNLFAFPGFPQILVADPKDNVFKIILCWNLGDKKSEVSFDLSHPEAIGAANNFKNKKGVDKNIVDRVHASLASLEGAAQRRISK